MSGIWNINMMCDVMPTISEDGHPTGAGDAADTSGE